MELIEIRDNPGIYYIKDEKIEKYISNWEIETTKGKKIPHIGIDLSSKIYKDENRKKAIKDFSLLIRASKRIDHKMQTKRKKLKFEGVTVRDALKRAEGAKRSLLEDLIEEKRNGKTKPKENPLDRILNSVWDEFYNHKVNGTDPVLKTWKPTTAKSYKSFYSKWIEDTKLGKKKIGLVTKFDAEALINKVKTERSLRTASTVIEVLRPLFNWYYDRHDVNLRNPIPKKTYKLENERVVDVPTKVIKSLYEVMDKYENELFRNFMLWVRTGRRRGEIVEIKMKDIDLIDKSFLIKKENNKAGVDMEYKLRPELEATLPNEYDDEDYLFASPKNHSESIHVDSINKHWKKIKENTKGTFKLNGVRIDITELHLHDIRHIINGVLKRSEVPQEVREKVLGHKNQSINDRYGVAYYGDADKAYQLFTDIIYGVVPEDTKWSDYNG